MKPNTTQIDWKKMKNLIPAIVQNAKTKQVLMLGYMNEEAFIKTQKTGKVWFSSRSKKRLWKKGEVSGNELLIQEILPDCDGDALLIKVVSKGPTCHTGDVSCFSAQKEQNCVEELFETIQERKKTLPNNSYTASLFREGLDKICVKVEEESEEVIRAAKKETKQRLIEETVDVLYHLLILLVQKEISWNDISGEIQKRRK